MAEEKKEKTTEKSEKKELDSKTGKSAVAPAEDTGREVQPSESDEMLNEQTVAQVESSTKSSEYDYEKLDLLLDVSLQITVELGRKEMSFGEVLHLEEGSVIELNKLAEEPVEIFVNQKKIARGEVVVVDEHFGVRITKLEGPS